MTIRFGTRAEAFTLGKLGGLVIVVAVVAILVAIFKGNAPALADAPLQSVMDLIGTGEPRIAEFTAKPIDDNQRVALSFEVKGVLENIREIEVIHSHRKYADEVPLPLLPQPVELKDEKALNELKNGRGKFPSEGSIEVALQPGYNTFTLRVVTAKSKTERRGDITREIDVQVYNEEYLERYDHEFPGCSNTDLKQCNVIECKKYTFETSSTSGTCYEPLVSVLKEISQDFRERHVISSEVVGPPSPCGSVKETEEDRGGRGKNKITKIEFSGCSPEQVDAFNKEYAARAHMISLACFREKLTSEAEYTALDVAKMEELKEEAVEKTLACVNGHTILSGGRTPVESYVPGLRNFLDNRGFLMLGSESEFTRKEEVRQVIDRLLPTRFSSFEVTATDASTFTFEWSIKSDFDTSPLASFKIEQIYRQFARGDDKNPRYDDIVISKLGKETRSWSMFNNRMGRHTFVITMENTEGWYMGHTFASINIFNDTYLELYSGKADDCDDKVKVPDEYEACNVQAAKATALTINEAKDGDDIKKAKRDAYNSATIGDRALCRYINDKKGKSHLDSCTAEEIDSIYLEYTQQVETLKKGGGGATGKEDLYNCIEALTYIDYRIYNVCIIKKALVRTLEKKGWTDMRTMKDWEDDIHG